MAVVTPVRFAIMAIASQLVLGLSLVFVPTPAAHAATECAGIDVDGRPLARCSDAAGTYVVSLPPCRYEDGNVDGRPCLWRDSDTGAVYWVGSDNYRP